MQKKKKKYLTTPLTEKPKVTCYLMLIILIINLAIKNFDIKQYSQFTKLQNEIREYTGT